MRSGMLSAMCAGVASVGIFCATASAAQPILKAAQNAAANAVAAVKAAVAPGVVPAVTMPAGGELGLLQKAYTTLEVADHDYKGHRVAAMKAIQVASLLLGGGIQADGPGKEPQIQSDTQVRQAQAILQEALAGAGNRPKVGAQVNKAITELNAAISGK